MRMRGRAVAVGALAVFLLGCTGQTGVGQTEPIGSEDVPLLTGEVPSLSGRCFGTSIGTFVPDAAYGIAIQYEHAPNAPPIPPLPVAWQPGFTAQRVGSEIQVLDRAKQVVAVTGKTKYRHWIGDIIPEEWVGTPLPETGAVWICGNVVAEPLESLGTGVGSS